jgi:hypothetical protein
MFHANSQSDKPSLDAADYMDVDNFNAGFDDEITPLDSLGTDDDAAGQFVYAAEGGTVVSVDWLAEDGPASSLDGKDCAFVGTADVASP